MVTSQSERDIDSMVPIVRAANTVAVIAGAAAGDVPVGGGAVGHDGVDVGVDGAGDDPFVRLQTLRDDISVESGEDGVRLGRDGRQRGD